MVINKIFLKYKLDIDVFKFYIYNKICVRLFFSVCVKLSLLLILKRIEGKTYLNYWLPILFSPSLYSDFFKSVSDFKLILCFYFFLKILLILVFEVQLFPMFFFPSKYVFSKILELVYFLNIDWIFLILNLFLIACLINISFFLIKYISCLI